MPAPGSRASPSRAATLLLALSLVALPLVVAGPAEAATRELEWEYRVSVPDPASGNVRVELTLRNLEGIVERMTLFTLHHRDPISNLTGGPRTPLSTIEGGVSFDVDGTESIRFDVRVIRPAFRAGEFLSWSGSDFTLFKAESIAVAYTYRYYEGRPFVWKSRVVLEPPPGWAAAAPWDRIQGNEYALPEGDVLPRGYVVFGPFGEAEETQLGVRTLRYVRLGEAGSYERDLPRFLERATPYYEAVYGRTGDRNVLVINAPDPMFRGGLGASGSFFVHPSVDLRTAAHEYAHVFQRFGTTEAFGQSAIWFNEGDADYHSALSLFVTDFWSAGEVDEFLRKASAWRDDADHRDSRLVDATYGSNLERFAYAKGAVLLQAMHEQLQRATQGELGVADLVRRINDRHNPSASGDEPQRLVTNADIQAAYSELLGVDASSFFSRHVAGAEWPTPGAFVPEGNVVASNLVLTPTSAPPGEPVTATVTVANRGTSTISRQMELLVDGSPVGVRRLTLGVGESARLEFAFTAPAPGAHEVRFLAMHHTFRSLTDADVFLARTSLVPATPRAGEEVNLLVFLENRGEQAGSARLEALRGSQVVARSAETIVEGSQTTAVTLPLRFDTEGAVDIVLRLVTARGELTSLERLQVLAPDRDGDGVPDAEDAFPDNPRLSEPGPTNTLRNATPLGAWVAWVALICGALSLRRRWE